VNGEELLYLDNIEEYTLGGIEKPNVIVAVHNLIALLPCLKATTQRGTLYELVMLHFWEKTSIVGQPAGGRASAPPPTQLPPALSVGIISSGIPDRLYSQAFHTYEFLAASYTSLFTV
jgi:hypothetical protein